MDVGGGDGEAPPPVRGVREEDALLLRAFGVSVAEGGPPYGYVLVSLGRGGGGFRWGRAYGAAGIAAVVADARRVAGARPG